MVTFGESLSEREFGFDSDLVSATLAFAHFPVVVDGRSRESQDEDQNRSQKKNNTPLWIRWHNLVVSSLKGISYNITPPRLKRSLMPIMQSSVNKVPNPPGQKEQAQS